MEIQCEENGFENQVENKRKEAERKYTVALFKTKFSKKPKTGRQPNSKLTTRGTTVPKGDPSTVDSLV